GRQAAGRLAGGMTPHAVAHHGEQAAPGQRVHACGTHHAYAVLVPLAHTAGVGGDAYQHLRLAGHVVGAATTFRVPGLAPLSDAPVTPSRPALPPPQPAEHG